MHELSDVMSVHNEIDEQEARHQASVVINTRGVRIGNGVSIGNSVVRI
jgi:hypothetical protein